MRLCLLLPLAVVAVPDVGHADWLGLESRGDVPRDLTERANREIVTALANLGASEETSARATCTFDANAARCLIFTRRAGNDRVEELRVPTEEAFPETLAFAVTNALLTSNIALPAVETRAARPTGGSRSPRPRRGLRALMALGPSVETTLGAGPLFYGAHMALRIEHGGWIAGLHASSGFARTAPGPYEIGVRRTRVGPRAGLVWPSGGQVFAALEVGAFADVMHSRVRPDLRSRRLVTLGGTGAVLVGLRASRHWRVEVLGELSASLARRRFLEDGQLLLAMGRWGCAGALRVSYVL